MEKGMILKKITLYGLMACFLVGNAMGIEGIYDKQLGREDSRNMSSNLRKVGEEHKIDLFTTFQLLREIRTEEDALHTDIKRLLLTWVAAISLGNWSSKDMSKTAKNLNNTFFQSVISIRYPGNEMLLEWGKVDQEACFRFLNGKLIFDFTKLEGYIPGKHGNEEGKIVLSIAEMGNPLEEEFNLSKCGNSADLLTISTGYRKVKKAKNEMKAEIWLAPMFLVEKELNTTAGHFKGIFPSKWNVNASVGMFWNWGSCDTIEWYDYEISIDMDILSTMNFHESWGISSKNTNMVRWFVVNQSWLRTAFQLFHVTFES
jgi:hypothetical protein